VKRLLRPASKDAPIVVIMILPERKAAKNFAGLYFINPEYNNCSSGIGEAAAAKSRKKAQRLIFRVSALMFSAFFAYMFAYEEVTT